MTTPPGFASCPIRRTALVVGAGDPHVTACSQESNIAKRPNNFNVLNAKTKISAEIRACQQLGARYQRRRWPPSPDAYSAGKRFGEALASITVALSLARVTVRRCASAAAAKASNTNARQSVSSRPERDGLRANTNIFT